MGNVLSGALAFIREIVRKEAARLIAWASGGATAAMMVLASRLGVEFSPEFVAGVSAFVAVVATELIRQFVYSQETVEKIVEAVDAESNAPGAQ